jgi:hypothetical protein
VSSRSRPPWVDRKSTIVQYHSAELQNESPAHEF